MSDQIEIKEEDYQLFDELGLEDFMEYEELFKVVGDYQQGKVERDQLKLKLFELRFRNLSDEDLDKIIGETELIKDGNVSIFNCIIFLKKMIDLGTKEKFQRIKKGNGLGLFRIIDKQYERKKPNTFCQKERDIYSEIINKLLENDSDVANKLPISPDGEDLYEKVRDGIILAKLINMCEPNAINLDEIKKDENMTIYDKYDNLEKVTQAQNALGLNVETNQDDILDKNKERVNDLIAKILARMNTKKEDIRDNPDTLKLAQEEGETGEQIADLPIDDFLKRWFNNNLKEAGHQNELTNFTTDLQDGEKYVILLNNINPNEVDTSALEIQEPEEKFQKILDDAKRLGCNTIISPQDLLLCNEAINRLFTSEIYNATNCAKVDEDYDRDLMNAYIDIINKELCDEPNLRNKIPIDKENEEIFEKIKDGVILGKLINLADKNAINEDDIKTGEELSDDIIGKNLENVIQGAEKIGCPHKVTKSDIAKGRQQKDLEIIGDILGKVKIQPGKIENNPEVDNLLQEGETKEDLAKKLPYQEFLKRWTNFHLKKAGSPRELNEYGTDLNDCEILTTLLNDIEPTKCDKSPLEESDPEAKAQKVILIAKKIGADSPVPPDAISGGHPELQEIFLGEIYNAHLNPFDESEKHCYCKMINKLLEEDQELAGKIPIDENSNEIFKKMKDGVILSKLINILMPNTIDERVIIKDDTMTREDKKNNLNLTINSGKSVGCMIETTAEDVLNEDRSHDINLLYQILKPIALKKIAVQDFPQLLRLKENKEENEQMLTLGPEDFLKRWFNLYLTKANYPRKVNNFSEDLKDIEKLGFLLNQLNPELGTEAINEKDPFKRAEFIIQDAEKLGAKIYIKPEDLLSGNEHLNILFLSELFLANHGMGEATQEEKLAANKLLGDDDEGGREERSFRTWINSLKLEGVKKVNNLYEECKTALLLLKTIDKIKPGSVNWKNVQLKAKNTFSVGVNCQEVIEACKRSGYNIISIGNKDIQEGKKKHILAIVWQLMRAHTLKVIGEKSEEELIAWANTKVTDKRKIKSLKEKKLNDGLFWIDLLSAIEPRCIRWDLVSKDNLTDKDREMNAKYALSVARGLGAMIFVVWEDITEVKSRLLLTFLASLYDLAKTRESQS